MSGKLVIVRHGESEMNKTGQWCGWTDVSITEKGMGDAHEMGKQITDIKFDDVFTSKLKRTVETMQGILETQGQSGIPFESVEAINERDYGEYTGMNKWEVKEKVGEEKFNSIRRDFVCEIPGGETLKDVYDRAVPWYRKVVVPKLLNGENVLIVAHGNSIRALLKYIESISDEGISQVEMVFGTILIFTVDQNGKQLTKEVRTADITPTHA